MGDVVAVDVRDFVQMANALGNQGDLYIMALKCLLPGQFGRNPLPR